MFAIEIIPASQINFLAWDKCIQASKQNLIYGTTQWLNNLCDNWYGIVWNDYETVMPVCYRKKWGIPYAYMPPFTQQLGIFGPTNITFETHFYKSISYGDYHFNTHHYFNNAVAKTNFVIDLSVLYHTIAARYKKDLQHNLKKAAKEGFEYKEVSISVALSLYQQYYATRTPHVKAIHYFKFGNLCSLLEQQQRCFARCIYNNSNQIMAVALLVRHEKRIYNMMNTTTPAGRNSEANHFLLDRIFHEFAGNDLIFDFEGSDLPGVKSFYEKFAPTSEPYFHLHFNRLPWPIKLLKT
jgi:hypothetical protein